MKIQISKIIYPYPKWTRYILPKKIFLNKNKSMYRWLNFIIIFDKTKSNKKQTTFCYCPKCHTELISTGHVLADLNCVYYKCNHCSNISIWDFDAPTPILQDTKSLGRIEIEEYKNINGIWKEVRNQNGIK